MSWDLTRCDDGVLRCGWCTATPMYQQYHDQEWGRPVADDRRLFEKLCLESLQAGLSWRTILEKRSNFRAAFHQFDWVLMAALGPQDVERLLQNAGIIRHRGKIEAVINNAQRMPELLAEFGSLAAFVWSFEGLMPAQPELITLEHIRKHTTSPASDAMAKSLKKRGWKFLGSTTLHAFMQSMGLINDHLSGCASRDAVLQMRDDFIIPS
jgi:DNA-3-methyladenine glycosylase I